MKDYFLLYSSCIPVKGAEKSLIMDLDKGSYIEIPNLLHEILQLTIKKQSVNNIKSKYLNKYDRGIDEYFNFLFENSYGFFTKNPKPFQTPDTAFYSPYKVISSIIAVDENTTHNLKSVLMELSLLSCQIIQLRYFKTIKKLNEIENNLQVLKESTSRKIEIFIPYNENFSNEELEQFLKTFPRVILIFYSAPFSKKSKIHKQHSHNLFYSTEKITQKTKEKIAPKYFTITHQMFYEALNFSAGLHRKVCIDTDGTIKNYLTHNTSYGNIKDHKISSIIEQNLFKDAYSINNDSIEKCKDCQFRYMCLNNSEIIKKDNLHYKVDTCSFDPYTNSWN